MLGLPKGLLGHPPPHRTVTPPTATRTLPPTRSRCSTTNPTTPDARPPERDPANSSHRPNRPSTTGQPLHPPPHNSTHPHTHMPNRPIQLCLSPLPPSTRHPQSHSNASRAFSPPRQLLGKAPAQPALTTHHAHAHTPAQPTPLASHLSHPRARQLGHAPKLRTPLLEARNPHLQLPQATPSRASPTPHLEHTTAQLASTPLRHVQQPTHTTRPHPPSPAPPRCSAHVFHSRGAALSSIFDPLWRRRAVTTDRFARARRASRTPNLAGSAASCP